MLCYNVNNGKRRKEPSQSLKGLSMYIYSNDQKRSDAISCTNGRAAKIIKDILSGKVEKAAKHVIFTYNK